MRPARREVRLDAIARDDALLDSLGAGERPADDPIALALYEWRCEVEAEPFPAGVRHGAVARLRGRVGRGVATGAVASAIGLLSLGGVAAAATQAGPDSALWPITRVVAADRVPSREAAFHARNSLDRASTAAEQDRRDAAERYLAEAEQDTVRVRQDDGGAQLRDEAARLRLRLQSPGDGAPSASPEPSPSGTPSASPTTSGQPTPAPAPSDPATSEPTPSKTAPSPTREPSRDPQPRNTAAPRKTASPRPTASPTASPAAQPGMSDGAKALLHLLLTPSARP